VFPALKASKFRIREAHNEPPPKTAESSCSPNLVPSQIMSQEMTSSEKPPIAPATPFPDASDAKDDANLRKNKSLLAICKKFVLMTNALLTQSLLILIF
jgi:hypothetical protein